MGYLLRDNGADFNLGNYVKKKKKIYFIIDICSDVGLKIYRLVFSDSS